MLTSAKKKRGAPPANTNALKHGVYSHHYTPEELLALDRDLAGSLKDELEILYLVVFDTAESILAEPEASFTFQENCTSLRTLSVAVARLVNLICVRMTAFGDPDRREKQVDAMLALMEQSEVVDLHQPGDEPSIALVGAQNIAPVPIAEAHVIPEAEHLSPVPHSKDKASPSPPSRKISGGQPGNSNAWKHGFYVTKVTPAEKTLLQGAEVDQMRHEETLLRVLIRRTYHSMLPVRSALTIPEKLFATRTICFAVSVIANLQRSRRRLFGDLTDLEKDIQFAIAETCSDLGILDYFREWLKK